MSLFGALMGDLDDDPIFGHHMRSMRQMNSLMNSLMTPDPFSMLNSFDGMGGAHSALTGIGGRSSSLMPFGVHSMPNINRLLNGDLGDVTSGGGASYCSSSFVSMTQGPDGRPQVYQATSSTKAGPGGIKETRKTVQDSRTGVKKMAIGHHIGERAHIIEKEQNIRNGQLEERQDFINLDEDEAEDFDREFTTRARQVTGIGPSITSADRSSPLQPRYRQTMQALPAPPISAATAIPAVASATAISNSRITTTTTNITTTPSTSNSTPVRRLNRNCIPKVNSRRPLRTPSSSPLALTSQNPSTSSPSVHPHPYHPHHSSGAASRRNRHKKPSSRDH